MKNLLILFTLLTLGCSGSDNPSGSNDGSNGEKVQKTVTKHIKVDQFGYLPEQTKIAIITDPKIGFNANSTYFPSNELEVRKTADDTLVYTGSVTPFNNGLTDTDSGDKIWHFDFTRVQRTGEYYLYDKKQEKASYTFRISDDVYETVLKQAVRTFYYQRAGFAKAYPFVDSRWADSASHLGLEQDSDARLISNTNSSTSKDLRGGWYDAGDFNKYVNFADGALHNLLFAYSENPTIWGDNYNIAESGNGIPDLLDEVKYELDWLLRMQNPDGSVLHKVASVSWDATPPPSTDNVKRRYGPESASATISAAGAFAHAALIFKDINPDYATTLKNAAVSAWDWIGANESKINEMFDNTLFVNADSEDSLSDKKANRVNAAIYLFALTGETAYKNFISTNYKDIPMFSDAGGYLDPDGIIEESQNAVSYYTTLTGADSALVSSIKDKYSELLESPYNDFAPLRQFKEKKDGYLSYIDTYYWGSNRVKAQAGNSVYNPIVYHLLSTDETNLKTLAGIYLNYLHGLNPMSIVYLSNMEQFGAENSVDEFYHMWFADGSVWDNVNDSYGPPPGFVVGGANENYNQTGVYMQDGFSLISEQPASKSYRSWNGDELSYEITENSITYQSAYIRLLSKFVK